MTLLVQNVEKGVHQIGSRITDFAEGGDADILSAYNRNQPPLAVVFAQEQQVRSGVWKWWHASVPGHLEG